MSEDNAGQAGNRNILLSALNAIDQAFGWLERVVVAGSVLIMAGLMSAHVVGNLLFDRGIPGTYEVTEMLIVVMTFVGVGYAARCARHISMSAIYDQLSGWARKAMLIVICLGTGALMFYFAYKSAQYDITLYERGRASSSLGVPLWMVNLALPIGFTLAGVQYLLTIVRNLISDDIYRSFNEKEEYSDIPLDDSGQTHTSQEPHGV
ncbi:tripartite ATP-independent periplasmic transporter DctQ protein [Salinisphaera shabanensis E1L3A]|jgi:TRAP-type C4-dicarboxylate transport system permease small subunit|uniref:TRAP transporter small permease protein n=1 Tax=Salinisphaera shabanensis E1L3A TaxID=1033802 RepID=U2G200_9GAMM|nr:TRAP transporter small permease [Salinisphaera shabanensis]ERJ20248.1 tripartite ATP-independent periplasmic transporter DctQ protein [Salinisphaera shabanensis E1L3A]